MDKNRLGQLTKFTLDKQLAIFDELIKTNEVLANVDEYLKGVNLESLQGKKGERGDMGEIGEPGYSPIKGEDYFTEQDKEELLNSATPIKGVHYFTDQEIAEFKKEVTPKKGKDYFDGRHGIDGLDGKNGKDAIIDHAIIDKKLEQIKKELEQKDITVDEVIKAIKELKGNDRLDISNIKNAPQNLPRKGTQYKLDDQRWHGGGITASSIFIETPSGLVNGVNLTYTVLNTITAVINFTINGQFIHPAEFTFTGKTITFLVALPLGLAGTAFTIVYV